ncbi:MAG: prolyl oligopeptidase family serine peptidase [Chitinophagaceae bacterium]|nr:prolyl oligopeptidase family serine peptidase [Chitinophagaceae bacterium]
MSLLCSALWVGAQDTVYLTKALKTDSTHHYGREAIYTDLVAMRLYEGGAAPTSLGSWREVQADSLHQFRTRGFSNNGYLYLTYTSPRATTALLNVKGCGSLFFNAIPHAGDAYGSGWLYIPVLLKKGLNELYLRPAGLTTVRLIFPGPEVSLNIEDPTLPMVNVGAVDTSLYGAVVVINRSARALKAARIRAVFEGKMVVSDVPEIPAMTIRKVPFRIDARGVVGKGKYVCKLELLNGNRRADEKSVLIEVVEDGQQYTVTFFSGIDGSLQYYAVTPQAKSSDRTQMAGSPDGPPPPGTVFAPNTSYTASQMAAEKVPGPALFLSVHGAGVEAIGQARAYQSKTWGTLVAATNRRPRGFNWEDWGRKDAMEVLELAKARFHPDERYIYLTGHSMGGHGTWYLGATYPDHWAAIGACSGYPTLREYGSHDGVIPDSGRTATERLLLRASNQSDVIRLSTNYAPLGVYILHGDSDKVVPVRYARQMRKVLGEFHSDVSYHEVPGAEHWFGNQSVDWRPLFDFFQWHQLAPNIAVNDIDFITANPGISATYRWATIEQQTTPLDYSHIRLHRDIRAASITGSTENVQVLAMALGGFGKGVGVSVRIDNSDGLNYTTKTASDTVYLYKQEGAWKLGQKPGLEEKNPLRSGTFKEAFDHHMVFVYATSGSREEQEWSFNKARYDAETWYYRGNGAVDIVSDVTYVSGRYQDRNVILYGNAVTNSAWGLLLKDCPIQVKQGELSVGGKVFRGDDLAAYFIRPLPDGVTSIGVVAGTGLKGMQAANANQYFAGGSGFPDYMIFRLQMLQTGVAGILEAGFFGNNWKLAGHE